MKQSHCAVIGRRFICRMAVFALIRKKLLRYSELDADRLRVKKLIETQQVVDRITAFISLQAYRQTDSLAEDSSSLS